MQEPTGDALGFISVMAARQYGGQCDDGGPRVYGDGGGPRGYGDGGRLRGYVNRSGSGARLGLHGRWRPLAVHRDGKNHGDRRNHHGDGCNHYTSQAPEARAAGHHPRLPSRSHRISCRRCYRRTSVSRGAGITERRNSQLMGDYCRLAGSWVWTISMNTRGSSLERRMVTSGWQYSLRGAAGRFSLTTRAAVGPPRPPRPGSRLPRAATLTLDPAGSTIHKSRVTVAGPMRQSGNRRPRAHPGQDPSPVAGSLCMRPTRLMRPPRSLCSPLGVI